MISSISFYFFSVSRIFPLSGEYALDEWRTRTLFRVPRSRWRFLTCALTCVRQPRKVARAMGEEEIAARAMTSTERDRTRSGKAARERRAPARKIVKSPGGTPVLYGDVTDPRFTADASRRRRRQVLRPFVFIRSRLHRGGEERFCVAEGYKAPPIGCSADSPHAPSQNDDVVRESVRKTGGNQ